MMNRNFSVKDPGSSLTHLIGLAASLIMTPILLIHAASRGAVTPALICLAVFMAGTTLLYGASTTYHTFRVSARATRVLRKIDHMMIFVLITATYVPCCLIIIGGRKGILLLLAVSALSLAGMIMNGVWITCPKWLSSIIYIALGWSCLTAFPELIANRPFPAFLLLLAGGIFYTVGGILYATKIPVFQNRYPNFRIHEVFHLFVLAGTICHTMMMYLYLI